MIDQYIDELEVELRAAARRRLRLAAARAPHVPVGAIGTLTGLAICLIVALVALQTSAARHAPSSAAVAPVPTGARDLVGALAVFRRPQTAADRIPHPIPRLIVLGAAPGDLSVVPSLTRLVDTLPGGHRIFLAIGKTSGSSPYTNSTANGRPTYVVVWLETPFLRYEITPGRGRSVTPIRILPNKALGASPALTAHALLHPNDSAVPEGIPHDPQTNRPGPETWLEIVPDGVASARWTVQYPGTSRAARTLPVSNNVALLTVANSQRDHVWSISWLGSDHHVIATLGYRVPFQ